MVGFFPPSDAGHRKEGGGVGSSFSRLVSSLLLLLPVLLLLMLLLLLAEVRFVRTGFDTTQINLGRIMMSNENENE